MGCGCNDNENNISICNCSLIGRNATSIDMVSQPGDVLVSSPFFELTSPLNTIEVNKVIDEETNTITFEIEKDCCPDRYVKAGPSDATPGVLFNDKIVVDTSGPLTYDLINPLGDAHVEIGFDMSKLPAVNKVSNTSGCTPKYLSESLSTSDETYFSFENVACKSELTMKPTELFYADIYTVNKTEFGGLTPNTSGFEVLPATNQSVVSTIPSWVTTTNYSGNNTRTVTIGRDGWYQVNMGGSAVVAKGIHTLRSQIYLNKGAGNAYPILDDRFEGPWFKGTGTIALSDLEFNVSEIIKSDILSNGGIEAALGRGIRGHGFGQGRTIFLEQGDLLTFFSKWNTVVRENNDPVVLYEFAYTARGNDDLTDGDGSGVFWSVAELPLGKLTD